MKKRFIAFALVLVLLIPNSVFALENIDEQEPSEVVPQDYKSGASEVVPQGYEYESHCTHEGMSTECWEIDSYYHEKSEYCYYCNESTSVKEKHTMEWHKVYGDDYDCDSEKVYWMYYCPECLYKEFDGRLYYTMAYKNSKKIKIYLAGKVCNGDVIKVKIGKKTYKKTLWKSEDPVVSIKIKKPRKNSKIYVYLYHRGKKIYLDYEYVMTSENPRKGMTKKQVKYYTTWGSPDSTRSASGGYSYWFWDDGTYVVFKHGRVKKWYG